MKPGYSPIKQKARPIPYHLPEAEKNELKHLITSGYLERLENGEQDCFYHS